jgi:hypothetical protein
MPECHYCKGSGREKGFGYTLCPECGGCGRRDRKVVDPKATKAADLILKLGVREPTRVEGPQVVQIAAGKPWTGHVEAARILQSLAGEVRICDPYYGQGSLMRLAELTSATAVQFLTQRPDNKEKSFLPKAIRDFVTEHPHIELREHVVNDIHDRYIVTADELVILGHGLKDIGSKESFVVRLHRDLIPDTLDERLVSFDQKWQAARPLP